MASLIVIVIIVSMFFGALTSLFMVISISTDRWESITYQRDKLLDIEGLVKNESNLDTKGFYKIVVNDIGIGSSGNKTTYLLRNTYGGVWKLCDKISDNDRNGKVFTSALEAQTDPISKLFYANKCFNYVTQYEHVKDMLEMEKSQTLYRMQNSVASCSIVAVLCLATAILTGAVGITQRQVSACMVTGVMYAIAGVFMCFSLVIMLTKDGYQKTGCYSIDPMELEESICHSKIVSEGYSIPIAWTSFSMAVITLACWLYLARCYRLETAKSMV